MSMFKKDIFKWSRRSRSAHPKSPEDGPLVIIGTLDKTANPVARDLHTSALDGRHKEINRLLESGICADFPNRAGQTPLFCAAIRGHFRAVEALLQNGASPNEKDNKGMTPVHAACLRGSLRMLGAMIEYGGDLRLHDNEGNSCLDWAKRQPDPRRRMKMLEFLQKSQLFALNYSGDFSKTNLSFERQPSILQMLRNKVGSHISLDVGQEAGVRRVRSHGFGQVYYGGDSDGGILSVIPLITENLLTHDDSGVSFESTSHLVMESMRWDMTPVTVKEPSQMLHRENTVDLLISELERMSKLRHPNILLLMGLCQSTNLDSLMLVFERVSVGSLHHLLYDKMERLPMMTIRDIARQVCEGMLYIHHQNFLHCGLSSHAVFLVSLYQAKIGSFEYMVERKKAEVGRSSIVSSAQHISQLYRWIAPEVLMGEPPTVVSDIYSFCCVLWEMVASELPWKSKTLEEVVRLFQSQKGQLSTDSQKMPALFRGTLEVGLKSSPLERPPDFIVLQQWLLNPIDRAPGWKASSADRLASLQRESEERFRFGGTGSPNEYSATSDSDTSRRGIKSESQSANVQHGNSQMGRSKTDQASIAGSGESSRATNETNNHYPGDAQHESLHGSWSSLGGSESDDIDAVCGKTDREEKQHHRRYWREMSDEFRMSRNRLPRRQHPVSHSEISGLFLSAGQLPRQHRRSANIPWEGSLGLLRAGNASPRLGRFAKNSRRRNTSLDPESDGRTLPPVKPASHSTDIKSFSQSSRHSTGAFQVTYSCSKLKSKSLDRSCPSGRSPRLQRRAVSHPRSEHDETDDPNPIDIELKNHGSVRSLAEHFQTHVINHNLRQSILRGSMNPQGVCLDGARLSPELRVYSLLDNIMKEKKRRDEEELDQGSNKGSVTSLTTVSARDSATDEDAQDHRNRDNETEAQGGHRQDTEEDAGPMPAQATSPGNIRSQSTNAGDLQATSSINSDVAVGSMVESSLPDYTHSQTSQDPSRDAEHTSPPGSPSPTLTRPFSPTRPSAHLGGEHSGAKWVGDDASPRRVQDDSSLPRQRSGHTSRDFGCGISAPLSKDDLSLPRARDDLSLPRPGEGHSSAHTDPDTETQRHRQHPAKASQPKIDSFSHINKTNINKTRDASPHGTADRSSPYYTKESRQPRHTRERRSSRSRDDRSPHRTRRDVSPRCTGSDIAPRVTGGDVSPRHTESDTFPRHPRGNAPSRYSDDYGREYMAQYPTRRDLTQENDKDELFSRPGKVGNKLAKPSSPSAQLSGGCCAPPTQLSGGCGGLKWVKEKRPSRKNTEEISQSYTRPPRDRRERSPRRSRRDVSPGKASSPGNGNRGQASDDLSPPDLSYEGHGPSYEPSPRKRDRHSQKRREPDRRPPRRKEDAFDFQEYYIDDDFIFDEGPDTLDSYTQEIFCDIENPKHTQENRIYVQGKNQCRQNQAKYQPKKSQGNRVGDRESQEREYPDDEGLLREERELQSASDTASSLRQASSFTPQRCIVLNLERTAQAVESPRLHRQQQVDDSLENLSNRSLYGTDDNDGDDNNEVGTADDVDRVDERQQPSPAPSTSPTRQCTLHKFYLGPDTCPGGYTTTLRVESSLESPGSHRITHTATDKDTGITHTMHEETVAASTLRTTLGVQ